MEKTVVIPVVFDKGAKYRDEPQFNILSIGELKPYLEKGYELNNVFFEPNNQSQAKVLVIFELQKKGR